MLTIKITDEIKQEAAEHAKANVKTISRPSFTGIGNTEETYYLGYCGELALREYLKFTGKKFIYRTRWGKPDDGDFIFYMVDGSIRVADIKCGTKPFHQHLLIPQKQYERVKYDFYIGGIVDIENSQFTLHGYCTPDMLSRVTFDIDSMGVRLEKLNDLDLLLEDVRDND